MLRSVIAFCLSRRPLVLISFAAFLALGSAAFMVLNIEAYPDPAPPIIEIIAQNPGQSPEEMERYVTIPIEIAVASTPADGISEIFRYELKGPPGMDLTQLKTLQDWVVERKLRIVPGVSDVLVLGGKTKEFQAEVDLNRMMSYGLTLP